MPVSENAVTAAPAAPATPTPTPTPTPIAPPSETNTAPSTSEQNSADTVPVSSGEQSVQPEEGGAVSLPGELPSHEDFDWAAYTGDNYDIFDERLHPWLEGVSKYWAGQVEETRRLFDALSLGEEDPRIAELATAKEQAARDLEALQTEFEEYRKQVDERQAEETERYFAWFKSEYASRVEEAPEAWDAAKALLTGVYDAIEAGGKYPQLAVHEFFELAEAVGAEAVTSALDKISEGWPWDAVLQVYLTPKQSADTSTTEAAAAPAADPVPTMNRSAELVADSGQTRAADLKTPTQTKRRPQRQSEQIAARLLRDSRTKR